jgi:hypothetical protein
MALTVQQIERNIRHFDAILGNVKKITETDQAAQPTLPRISTTIDTKLTPQEAMLRIQAITRAKTAEYRREALMLQGGAGLRYAGMASRIALFLTGFGYAAVGPEIALDGLVKLAELGVEQVGNEVIGGGVSLLSGVSLLKIAEAVTENIVRGQRAQLAFAKAQVLERTAPSRQENYIDSEIDSFLKELFLKTPTLKEFYDQTKVDEVKQRTLRDQINVYAKQENLTQSDKLAITSQIEAYLTDKMSDRKRYSEQEIVDMLDLTNKIQAKAVLFKDINPAVDRLRDCTTKFFVNNTNLSGDLSSEIKKLGELLQHEVKWFDLSARNQRRKDLNGSIDRILEIVKNAAGSENTLTLTPNNLGLLSEILQLGYDLKRNDIFSARKVDDNDYNSLLSKFNRPDAPEPSAKVVRRGDKQVNAPAQTVVSDVTVDSTHSTLAIRDAVRRVIQPRSELARWMPQGLRGYKRNFIDAIINATVGNHYTNKSEQDQLRKELEDALNDKETGKLFHRLAPKGKLAERFAETSAGIRTRRASDRQGVADLLDNVTGIKTKN